MAKKETDDKLISVCKDGETIEISPATLAAHKLRGWVVLKDDDDQKTYSINEVKKMVADAVKAALAGGKENDKAKDGLERGEPDK